MNRIKITLLALTALMATAVAMSGCGSICNHIDNDQNKLCDLCGASLETAAETDTALSTVAADSIPETEPEKWIKSSITVKDQYGNLIAGAVLQINDEENTLVETVTTSENGSVDLTLKEGSYTAVFMELPEYHLGGSVGFAIKEGDATPTLEITNNTPDGTEAHPFFLNSESATFAFDANTTLYFSMFAGDRRSVVIENAADLIVTFGGTTYTPDQNGVIRVPVKSSNQQSHLSLSVQSKTAQDVTVGIVSESGSSDNPIVIEALSETPITATVPWDSIMYYTYTAKKDCTVYIRSEDPTNNISLTNRTTSEATNFTNGSTEKIELTVKAGDILVIGVSVVGGDPSLTRYEIPFIFAETVG